MEHRPLGSSRSSGKRQISKRVLLNLRYPFTDAQPSNPASSATHHGNPLTDRRHLPTYLNLIVCLQQRELPSHLRPEGIERLHHPVMSHLALLLQGFKPGFSKRFDSKRHVEDYVSLRASPTAAPTANTLLSFGPMVPSSAASVPRASCRTILTPRRSNQTTRS